MQGNEQFPNVRWWVTNPAQPEKPKWWMYEHELAPVADPDLVNSPSHYVYKGFEVVDVLNEAFPDDPHLWNAGKYLLRAKRKGNESQDLRKAIRMIEYRLAVLDNGN